MYIDMVSALAWPDCKSSATGIDVPGCGGMNRLGGGKVFATF